MTVRKRGVPSLPKRRQVLRLEGRALRLGAASRTAATRPASWSWRTDGRSTILVCRHGAPADALLVQEVGSHEHEDCALRSQGAPRPAG